MSQKVAKLSKWLHIIADSLGELNGNSSDECDLVVLVSNPRDKFFFSILSKDTPPEVAQALCRDAIDDFTQERLDAATMVEKSRGLN